jgi:hypothetical protein
MNLDSLITGLNDGDNQVIDKIRAMFGSLPKFIKYYVKKRKKLDQIQLQTLWGELAYNESDSFNAISKDILDQAGAQYFTEFLDVEYENGSYYFKPWSLRDLNALFDGSHSTIVDGVFDQDWFRYFDTENYTDYFYDIVHGLDSKNKNHLKDNILKLSHGFVFDESDFENPPYSFFNQNNNFIVSENIDDIMTISELFNEVIELNPFSDLKTEVEDLYNMSYNEAWNEITYKLIWDSLSDFFDPEFTWVNNRPKIRIIDFPGFLKKFFNCFDNDSSQIIVDQYDFISFVHTIIRSSCLEGPRFKILSYPPEDKVYEYINDSFIDYIT